MGCAKGTLFENCDSLEIMWFQHVVSKSQERLPEMTKRVMEVWDKTCCTTDSTSAVVSEEVEDESGETNGFEGQIVTTQGREPLFCSCMNFYSLQ